ncbi:hypothetical protein MMC12_004964 [Toensbergia leucococca]|nr:hypothetical protein [Toensbergia leucococca]
MATLTLQRASWQLQICRTSRTFAISFSTSLPRRTKPTQLFEPLNPLRSTRRNTTRPPTTSTRPSTARTAFTSTRVHQAQQDQRADSAPSRPKPTSNAPQQASTTSKFSSPRDPNLPSSDLPDLTSGLSDEPIVLDEGSRQVDWSRSFHGLSTEAFSKEAADALLQPVLPEDIEVKPDGIIYLPEIKYRRILNKAFGPGAWGLAPRGETIVTSKAVTREYGLVALGRLVSIARGEMDYFSPEGIPTAVEGCKSNALMRCCKDLGVASELWDPRYIRKFVTEHVRDVFVEHVLTKKRKKVYMRKDDEIRYPFKEIKYGAAGVST